ncbi:MAG: glycosyltransferase, partial [Eubacteriales bacterium]
MSQYAIIVVAYNRPDSLKRLLKSIESANYLGDEVTLIISIDRSNTNEVTRIAELFEWCNGKKEIRTFDCNQGLRRHILACGEYLDTYEAVAVLEDDIVVSPHFYNYMKQTINFYGDDDQIAGISLYKHEWNVVANLPFHPLDTQFDTYFMQFAQSWGQIWLRKQWNEFIKWYKENPDIFHEENKKFPHTIASWSDSSWLKYHIRYCVETNKVFVYPYVSLSTCYTEVGIHNKTSISRYQVPMQMSYVEKYNFMKYANQSLCYDVYMENVQLANQLKTQYGNVCIDLYGKKDWLYIDEN